jgi:2'-5' RNA ligase
MADKLFSAGHDGGLDQILLQSFLERAGPDAAYFFIPAWGSELIERAQYDVFDRLGDATLEPQESDTFHITLMIVNKISDEQVDEFFERLSPIMPLQFQVMATEIITFQEAESVPVVLRIDPSPSLLRLQSELYNVATSMGLDITSHSDPREYKPHITLGTGLEPRDTPVYQLDRPFMIPVDSFVVTRNGYKKIWTVDLPTMDKDRILVTVDEREGEAVMESNVNQDIAISRSALISLLKGEPLLIGGLNRVVTLDDGPFMIYDDGEPVRRIAPPEPEPEPITEPEPEEPTPSALEVVRDQISLALKKFADNMAKLVGRGGPGSGHHGHEGRPGEVGGSLPSGTQEEQTPRPASLGRVAGNLKKFMDRVLGMRDAIKNPKTDINLLDNEVEFKEFTSDINGWDDAARQIMFGAVLDIQNRGNLSDDEMERLREELFNDWVAEEVWNLRQKFQRQMWGFDEEYPTIEEWKEYLGLSEEEARQLSTDQMRAMILHRQASEFLEQHPRSDSGAVRVFTYHGAQDSVDDEDQEFYDVLDEITRMETPYPMEEDVSERYGDQVATIDEALADDHHRLYIGYSNETGDRVSAAYVHILDELPANVLSRARDAYDRGQLNIDFDQLEGQGYVYLDRLGSSESGQGYGTEQMMNVLALAYDMGYGVVGSATSGAKSFYDKLGANWISEDTYGGGIGLWTSEQVKKAGDLLSRFGMGEALEVRAIDDTVTEQDLADAESGFRVLELFKLDDPAAIAWRPKAEDYRKMFFDAASELNKNPREGVVVKGHLRRISIQRGGQGSGHFGHAGRPGEVGGSLPSGAEILSDDDRTGRFGKSSRMAIESSVSTEDEIENNLRDFSKEYGGAWVYSLRRFQRIITYVQYDSPSKVPDHFMGPTLNTIGWKGKLVEFTAGAQERENQRGYRARGGPGSGHFDHEGRPGEVGGSQPSGTQKPTTGATGKIKKFLDRVLGMRNAIKNPKTEIKPVENSNDFDFFVANFNRADWDIDAWSILYGAVENIKEGSAESQGYLENLQREMWEGQIADERQRIYEKVLERSHEMFEDDADENEIIDFLKMTADEYSSLTEPEINGIILREHMIAVLMEEYDAEESDLREYFSYMEGGTWQDARDLFDDYIHDQYANSHEPPDLDDVRDKYHAQGEGGVDTFLTQGDRRFFVGYDNETGEPVSAAYVRIMHQLDNSYIIGIRRGIADGSIEDVDLENDVIGQGYIYLDRLGSRERGQGYGTEQMMNVLALAYDMGYGITGDATGEAASFYNQLGAKWVTPSGQPGLYGGSAFWTPRDVQRAGDLLKKFGLGDALETRAVEIGDEDYESAETGFKIFSLFEIDDPAVIARPLSSKEKSSAYIRAILDTIAAQTASLISKDYHAVVTGPLRRISIQRGGPGSGHFDHEGRPGEVGGSKPSGEHATESESTGGAKREKMARSMVDNLMGKASRGMQGSANAYFLGVEGYQDEEEIKDKPYIYFSDLRPLDGGWVRLPDGTWHNDRMIWSENPLPPEVIYKYELSVVTSDARAALMKELYEDQVDPPPGGEHQAWVFVQDYEEGYRGFVVHPSTDSDEGPWRASTFDMRGFSGHSYYDTPEEAIASESGLGLWRIGASTFEAMATQYEPFIVGNQRSMLKQRLEREGVPYEEILERLDEEHPWPDETPGIRRSEPEDYQTDDDLNELAKKILELMGSASIIERGGPGSGHHGHKGRPGKVGGSSPSGKHGRGVVDPDRLWDFIDLVLTRNYDRTRIERDEEYWKGIRSTWLEHMLYEGRGLNYDEAEDWIDNLDPRDRLDVLDDIYQMRIEALEGQDFDNAMDYMENNMPVGYEKALDIFAENLSNWAEEDVQDEAGEETVSAFGFDDRTPMMKENLEAARDNIYFLPYEEAYLMDSDGGMVLHKTDHENDSITFSDDDIARMDGGTLVHNHPRGTSLSAEDLILAIKANLREVMAVGNDGTVYVARLSHSNIGETEHQQQIVINLILQDHNTIRSRFQWEIRAGNMTAEQASFNHNHAATELFARNYDYIDYVVIEAES